MADDVIGRLPEEFRDKAAGLDAYAPAAAAAFREAAERVERAMRDAVQEPLSLRDAARVSGYTPDALARMIRRGTLRNVGRKHAPLVLRGDLPVKPKAVRPATAESAAAAQSGDVLDLDVAARAMTARRRVS